MRLPASVCLSGLIGLATILTPSQSAFGACATGLGGAIGLSTPAGSEINSSTCVQIGDQIIVSSVDLENTSISYHASNVNAYVILPSNGSNLAISGVDLRAGAGCDIANGGSAGIICPAHQTFGGATGTCVGFNNVYTVTFADIGRNLSFSQTVNGVTTTCSAAGQAGMIQFLESGAGVALTSGGANAGVATVCQTISVPVVFPCISITKECVNLCTPIGQPIQFRGTVSNTGDTPLVNVTVTDTPAGGAPTVVLSNITLAPGQSQPFTGSYVPTGNPCGPFTDTVSATATVACNGRTISNTDACINPQTGVSTGPRPPVTATCHVITAPAITLTKDCFKTGSPGVRTLNPGDTYVETFTVRNSGDVAVQNVVIHDTKNGVTTDYVCSAGPLAPGATCTFTTTPITPPAGFCGPITDQAVATADNTCPADATCPSPRTVTSAQQTCTVTVICQPRICIEKLTACTPSSGVCDANNTYAKTASGVVGASFCYKITISNCGQDVLNNVTVSDPDLGGTLSGFPTSLGIGQSATAFFKKSNWPVGTHVNTATTSGVGAQSGIRVTTNDTATVTLVPVSVTCALTLHSDFDLDQHTVTTDTNGVTSGSDDNHVTLPDSGPVTMSITINNTGGADLSVTVTGLPCTPPELAQAITIPAGQSAGPFSCSFDVTCPAGANLNVTVVGTAVASVRVPCVYDSTGQAVTTAPSSCTASVECNVITPLECRVTGGGILLPGNVDQSCIPVNTTIFPSRVNSLTVVKITHGGQLGAPFAQMDCGAILGNPCIRGQWQHTRHYGGTGNPRDVIDMDFHSATPKGVYDSLSCACLGCCDPASGAFIPPTIGPKVHKFALCNPDDHKVCGPEPRPAPANAIIWSGVGQIKPETDSGSNQKAAQWVVFRIYIEDRSEPGGNHPGGAVEPADIYCFQAWKTGILTSKKPDFTTIWTDFRRALGQANCDFLNGLQNGAAPIGTLPSPTVNGLTADIQDCGPMYSGNHQIHPATGATCNQ